MLSELVVEGLGVIDRAELALDRGSSALTGETGAGKTLVVAALSLLLGGRADRTLVREGAGEARVEGRFVLRASHPAVGLLRAHGLVEDAADDDVEIVISRSVPAGGRGGKVRVNGRLATSSVLAEAGAHLVEIAGQHEYQRLSSPARGREILDVFAGSEMLAEETAAAVRALAGLRRRVVALRDGERERTRELDVLRYEIAEIEGAAPRAGEIAELRVEATRLEHAERIAVAVEASLTALRGEGGADERVAEAKDALESVADAEPRAGELAARLGEAVAGIEDVAGDARGLTSVPDSAALEEVRARLDTLARLTRKYGDDDVDVIGYLERARARAAELEAAGSDLGALEAEAAALEQRARDAAQRLTAARREAAPRVASEAEELLASLAMPGARIDVSLVPRDLYEGGFEAVEIRIAANPGESPRPVSKVASGGELSRISLAFHLLARGDDATTLVFDEVDAGVGGAAAQSVGRALARLATESGAQVVVVTHLPQVAAFAEHHFTVLKRHAGQRAASAVDRVDGDARVAELSRMLSGLPDSSRAREHARELLDLAGAAS